MSRLGGSGKMAKHGRARKIAICTRHICAKAVPVFAVSDERINARLTGEPGQEFGDFSILKTEGFRRFDS
jgi:hypothetical protein